MSTSQHTRTEPTPANAATPNAKIRALHLIHRYLLDNMNWIYSLISNTPDTHTTIASEHFTPCQYYRVDFHYLPFFLKRLDYSYGPRIMVASANWFIEKLILWLYPKYINANLREGFNVVHAHFSTMGWRYRILRKKLGVPLVVSFYGYDYEQLPFRSKKWRKRYQVMFREVDHFICEGAHGKRILVKNGCPENKISVVHLGVNVEQIPFHRRSKATQELRLLQIAAFREKKGQRYTLEAFTRARVSCPNLHLTLVGSDPQGIRRELQSLHAPLIASGALRILDSITYNQLYEFMRDYQIFIHPSCYSADMDCEGGAPVVLLDAQATGMPIIATKHCDIPDEVQNGRTGLLVPERDNEALANAIAQFYFMAQADYDEYCNNARKHVEQCYDIAQNAKLLREIYDRMHYLHRSGK